MDAIILHGIWFAIGFFCGMVVMAALALASAISRTEVAQPQTWTAEYDEPEPASVTILPPTPAELAEAQATAKFYQEVYLSLAKTVKES